MNIPEFKKLLFILILLSILIPTVSHGQLNEFEDIEKVGSKGFFKKYIGGLFGDFTDFGDPFTVNGGVGINMRSYNAYGGPLRQDPFFYALNANLNTRIYKLNLPFSLTLTAKNNESSLPNLGEIKEAFKPEIPSVRDRFVRFGMSPYYKWIKLHLGHRAMNFSEFTLHNLNFYGIGAELTPGKVRVAAMYGRLAKAEPIDLSLTRPNFPVYQRIGWGTKVGYGDNQESIDLIVFGSEDDPNSISIPTDSPRQLAPEKNVVVGVNLQKLFLERIRLKVEYARSAINPNSLDGSVSGSGITSLFMGEKATTLKSSALDASINYEGKSFIAGLEYKRVPPNFRTHGAYFFNRDIVDVVGNLGFDLFNGLVNTQWSAGVQSNNLDLQLPTTTQRLIYSANITYAPGNFSANAYYNNNSSNVGFVLNQQLDSLNAVIITNDAGATFSYTISTDGGINHTLTLTGNVQDVNDNLDNLAENADTRVILGNFAYSMGLSSGWKFNTRLNYNQNEISQMLIKRYGLGAGVAKSFIDDKVNIGIDINSFWNSNDISADSRNLITTINLGYQVSQAFGIQTGWNLLRTNSDIMDPFSEVTGNLGIQYNFSYNPSQKKSNNGESQQ